MTEHAVAETIARELELVRDTAARKPKAWGALASRGVVTFRDLAGRAPTEDERRAIWAGLWQAAEALRVRRGIGADELGVNSGG